MSDDTPEGYEPVAVCPHITGYFQKGAYGTIRAECQECGWVSVDAPPETLASQYSGFGVTTADLAVFTAHDVFPANDESAATGEGGGA